MIWVGELGLALVGLAALISLAAVVASLPRALRFRRAALETRALLDLYRQSMQAQRLDIAAASSERDELLRPLRRVRRVVMHPLTVALFESYRRRRSRRTVDLG